MNLVKNRNMVVQVFLMIITFGFYWIYWFYQTSKELKAITNDQQAAPVLWTILCLVPFGMFYSFYCHAELYEKIASEKKHKWLIYVLWFAFSPIVWLLVQRDLNRYAEGKLTLPAKNLLPV